MQNIIYEKNKILKKDLLDSLDLDIEFSYFKKKKFFIIGGSGFIGSNIVKSLLLMSDLYSLNLEVYCGYRNSNNINKNLSEWSNHPNLQKIECDISKINQFPKIDFDFIIHSASIANPISYIGNEEEIINSNIDGTINILNNIKIDNLEKYIYISSGEVYGILDVDFIDEQVYGSIDPKNSRSIYPLSKKLSEALTFIKGASSNLKYNIVRPFHIYGPGMNLKDGKIHSDIIKSILTNSPIYLHSNGESIRSFCYISDATRAILTVLFKAKPSMVYNIGNNTQTISILDLCNLNLKRSKKKLELVFDRSDFYKQSPILKSIPSTKNLEKLGWLPKIDIETGFDRTIKYYSSLKNDF